MFYNMLSLTDTLHLLSTYPSLPIKIQSNTMNINVHLESSNGIVGYHSRLKYI